ncbi:MAG: twin-arginine translocation signal domain-containing protein, partial [Oceanibaculum sp.]
MNPKSPTPTSSNAVTRRSALKKLGAAAGAASALTLAPGCVRYPQAQSSAPSKLGFQV